MYITAVKFRRTEKSKYERGIMLGEDKLIVDSKNKAVPLPVYDYRLQQHELHINFPWTEEKEN
jgi:hypothetical protein